MGNDLLQVVRDAAIAAYPNEACGVVVSVGKKSIPLVCKNISPEPDMHFIIDPIDYTRASDLGEIIAIWHTHVELPPQPSEADLAGVEMTGLPWYIVSIYKDERGEFHLEGPTLSEPSGFTMGYLERPYVLGVFDCWTLVRDYYKREYDISLGDYPRIGEFWRKGYNFFGENWHKEGFVQLIDEEPRKGDLFLIQTESYDVPNHIAIYIGDDMILHHCHGRLSRRDIYGGYWSKHTTHHLRWKDFCDAR